MLISFLVVDEWPKYQYVERRTEPGGQIPPPSLGPSGVMAPEGRAGDLFCGEGDEKAWCGLGRWRVLMEG